MSLLLLDGHNLLYRSFTSLPRSITDGSKTVINGLYGMLGQIQRLMKELDPTHIIAAFDEPSVPTFRHQMYPAYQGQRGPLGGVHAANFAEQIALAKTLLPAMGIPSMTSPGYEADDVMGTLARLSTARGLRSIIVSTDRDLLQLVREGVEVYVPGSNPLRIGDVDGVQRRMGVPPHAITTLKALAGDPSDNIPGVKGIGVKTAASLVLKFDSLERIYASLSELPPRVAAALLDGQNDAFLFRRLVTIETNLDLNVSVESLPRPNFSPSARVRELLDAAAQSSH
jgi:DNA polymerase I